MLGKLFLSAAPAGGIEVVEIDLGTGLLYSVLGICVVFVMLLALMIVIKIMGVINAAASGTAKTESKPAPAAPAPTPAPSPAPAKVETKTEAPTDLGAYTIPVKTAAMIMAIVADEMGCEPNELNFKSIKRVSEHKVVDGCELVNVPDEKTAAMVMAVVADAMGCQPAELCFNSIKRV